MLDGGGGVTYVQEAENTCFFRNVRPLVALAGLVRDSRKTFSSFVRRSQEPNNAEPPHNSGLAGIIDVSAGFKWLSSLK